MTEVGRRARAAARAIGRAGSAEKDAALHAIAQSIDEQSQAILAANREDLKVGSAHGLDAALLDRLELNASRLSAAAEGLRQIAALADPVGAISDLNYRPSGIQVGRMRVPLGLEGLTSQKFIVIGDGQVRK